MTPLSFNPFPPSVLTNIGSHLPEGGWSVGADGGHGVIGRVLQVRQAGSQPLAQSVIRAGVAAVASPGQFREGRTPRRLCHRTIPAERRQLQSFLRRFNYDLCLCHYIRAI